jgi:DNA (cytosine-5)-methyltransferase 1
VRCIGLLGYPSQFSYTLVCNFVCLVRDYAWAHVKYRRHLWIYMKTLRHIQRASVSLFSGAGIGDLGIEHGCKIPVEFFAEFVEERVKLIQENYRGRDVTQGDLETTHKTVINKWKKKYGKKNPMLITLSPPCQGMSTNGAGKIASQVRQGKRPEYDKRNKLLLHGLEVVKKLVPEYVLIENVPGMKNTVIMWKKKQPRRLLRLIEEVLPKGYQFISFVVDFANFGVPHHRKRLITMGKWMDEDYDTTLDLQESPPDWIKERYRESVSIKQTISDLWRTTDELLHLEPSINEKHLEWVKAIPRYSGKSAHMNKCLKCKKYEEFREIKCSICKGTLPRPHVIENNKPRAVKGYLTSYRRMQPDQPANTLTMNSGVVSSDVTLHYSMDRVLTPKELLRLSTIINTRNKSQHTDFPWADKYDFSSAMKESDYLLQKNIIRQTIGECIPPLAMQVLVEAMMNDWIPSI